MEEQPVALAIDHAIAEQLGNQLDVGGLAAAGAGAGELEQGLLRTWLFLTVATLSMPFDFGHASWRTPSSSRPRA